VANFLEAVKNGARQLGVHQSTASANGPVNASLEEL